MRDKKKSWACEDYTGNKNATKIYIKMDMFGWVLYLDTQTCLLSGMSMRVK